MAYWTTSEENKDVYHIFVDCSEGEKIESQNRQEGPPPPGRKLCEICKKKRGY